MQEFHRRINDPILILEDVQFMAWIESQNGHKLIIKKNSLARNFSI